LNGSTPANLYDHIDVVRYAQTTTSRAQDFTYGLHVNSFSPSVEGWQRDREQAAIG
jgi:hypothetical protein